jgi:type II secretory pathway component GspD/PulD (secretin)
MLAVTGLAAMAQNAEDANVVTDQGAQYDLDNLVAPGVNGLIPGPLVYENAPVREVLARLAEWGGVNIVPEPEIGDDDRVSINVQDITWKQALNLVLNHTRPEKLTIEQETINMIVISKPPRVTASFKNAPLAEVVQTLAEYKGASVVISPEITRENLITFTFRDVPWNTALEMVVETAGFAIVKQPNNIIQVVHPRELIAQLEFRTFQLKHIRPKSTYIPKIDTLFIEKRKDRSTSSGGGGSSNNSATDRFLREFPFLEFLQTTLSSNLEGETVGVMRYDDLTNTIMVKDTKPVLDQIQSIVDELDVEPNQILLDVKFISTTNEDLLNFGTDYALGEDEGMIFRSAALDPTTQTAQTLTGGKVTRLPFGLGEEQSKTDQFFLTNYQMAATLRLFQRDRFSKLIQSPQLTALDNQEATIFVGETIHYARAESDSSQSGGATFTIDEASGSPVHVGFQLFIIPHVVKGTERVMMTVIPENKFLSGTSATATVDGFERFEISGAGPGGSDLSIDLPRVQSATVVTNMIIESGQTAVLGGLVVERSSRDVKKIPILGDIPVVNMFFRSTTNNVQKDHLIVFVTPRVIKSINDTEAELNRRLEKRRNSSEDNYDRLEDGSYDRGAFFRGIEERKSSSNDEFDDLLNKKK